MTDDPGGRVFFSSKGRSLEGEDEIRLLSVGVDIGSSTSHLVFSRIVLERLDARYVVSEREVFHQSDILLTPYAGEDTIDARALGAFIERAYKDALVSPEEIDTGALILTGVAVARRNARAIGELFAREAGKLVAVSAGDSLETIMAAHGSGAVARSIRDGIAVMNVDVGGGTSKIAVCADGRVAAVTALDVGARLICVDTDGTVRRIEPAGQRFGAELGLALEPGGKLAESNTQTACRCDGGLPVRSHARWIACGWRVVRCCGSIRCAGVDAVGALTFSGGVSEFVYGREAKHFDDLGAALAHAVRARVDRFRCAAGRAGRAYQGDRDRRRAVHHTGLGQHDLCVAARCTAAAQYPGDRAGFRVHRGDRREGGGELDPNVGRATRTRGHVAVFVPWRGSATFARLDAFCRGVVDGLAGVPSTNAPIVLAGDSDVGGLIGVHLREEIKVANPVVSIDGLELTDFDYIDIGALLENSGAVPVVIKSLVFPGGSSVGSPRRTQPAGP